MESMNKEDLLYLKMDAELASVVYLARSALADVVMGLRDCDSYYALNTLT